MTVILVEKKVISLDSSKFKFRYSLSDIYHDVARTKTHTHTNGCRTVLHTTYNSLIFYMNGPDRKLHVTNVGRISITCKTH